MRVSRLICALSSCAIVSSLMFTISNEAKSERSPLVAQATSPILQQQGVLERGDAVISSDSSLYDSYTFQGRAGQQVTINLNSSEFDTYLILLDSSGTVLDQNDDFSPNNTNSSLTVTLPANDTYTVFANSYDSSGRGRYALTVLSVGAAPPASRQQPEAISQQPVSLINGFQQYSFLNRFSIQYPVGWRVEPLENILQIYNLSTVEPVKTEIAIVPESFESLVRVITTDAHDNGSRITRRGNLVVGGREALRLWMSGSTVGDFEYDIITVIRYRNNETVVISSFYNRETPEVIRTIQDIHWSFRVLE